MTTTTKTPVAYSYIRFSSKKQEAGDSIRRQTADTAAWAERNGVALDTSLAIDRGISAFKGLNADVGALGEFLRQVNNGRVARGSYLVVESLDRLTRDDVDEALQLLLGMTSAGVRIVQLKPVEVIYQKPVDPMRILMMVMELMRGNSESKVKSQRVHAALSDARRGAREGGEKIDQRLPSWCEWDGDSIVLHAARAATVRRVFELVIAGYGTNNLIRKLIEEGHEPIGRAPAWNRTFVQKIVRDRQAVGEYQPKKNHGKENDGDAIKNYYPAVVDEQTYYAACASLAERGEKRGRTSADHVNVFSGLLWNARREDDSFVMSPKLMRGGRRYQTLNTSSAVNGSDRSYSIPYDVLEAAFVSLLSEIDPSEIVGGNGETNDVVTLSGQLAEVDDDLAAIKAALAKKVTPTLIEAAEAKDARKADLVKALDAAKARAAAPLSSWWGEAQALAKALAGAADPYDARLRLRTALRRIVDGVYLLVVPRGLDRLVAAQVRFQGSERVRDYLILHRPGSRHRTSGWWVRSLARDGEAPLDLRRPEHAAALAEHLETLDLTALTGPSD